MIINLKEYLYGRIYNLLKYALFLHILCRPADLWPFGSLALTKNFRVVQILLAKYHSIGQAPSAEFYEDHFDPRGFQ